MSGVVESRSQAASTGHRAAAPVTPVMAGGPRVALWVCLCAIAVYVAIGVFALPDGPWGDVKQGPLVLVVCLYPLIGAVIAHRLRTGDSYRVAWRKSVTRAGLLSLAGFALAAQVFFAAFMAWKAYLPRWGGFRADPLLADWDAWLHAGYDVWVLLGPLASTRPGLVVLDLIYHSWLPVLCLVMGWRAWAQDYRFFLAFALCWMLLGTALALLLHSAGPIFLQELSGTDRYADLTAHLASVPALRTHETYRTLWEAYAMGYPSSISAFPSMHTAMPTLWALACPARFPRLRLALATYAALIGIAAVGLGWHYAIDVYAAFAGAWFCWWVAGRVLRG